MVSLDRKQSARQRNVRLNAIRYIIYTYCRVYNWDVRAEDLLTHLESRGSVMEIGTLRQLCTRFGYNKWLPISFYAERINRRLLTDGKPGSPSDVDDFNDTISAAYKTTTEAIKGYD